MDGKEAFAQFKARLRQPFLFGGPRETPFTVQVSLGKEEPQTLGGELVSRGLIQTWMLALLVLACLCLAGSAAALGGTWYANNSHGTQTAVAYGQVVAAQVTQLFNATQTALNRPTATAPTATAPTATSSFTPSSTPLTPTDTPTQTPITPTDTPRPSDTPRPTDTPTFTATLVPSNTPKPPVLTTLIIVPPPIFLLQHWNYDLNLLSNRTIYYLRLSGPGTISASATWSGSQAGLALIVNGPGSGGAYARQDGNSGISVSYNVTDADFAKGDTWFVSIASFGSGSANGTVTITYPNGHSLPAFSDQFVISPNNGSSIGLFIPARAGTAGAEASWTGSPASLALILNGPNQVGYYARQDGGSPIKLSYAIQNADLTPAGYWRISLVAFSAANLSGTMNLSFP